MANRPPQTRYAQSSGAKIAFQVSGTGPPDLVMVHGLVSHLDLQWQQTAYRRFMRSLEQGGRLIRLDKRGTGLSDPTAELADHSAAGAGRGGSHGGSEVVARGAVRVV
jgi:pimeloyl-ACP methyl ester carboxylesterase